MAAVNQIKLASDKRILEKRFRTLYQYSTQIAMTNITKMTMNFPFFCALYIKYAKNLTKLPVSPKSF